MSRRVYIHSEEWIWIFSREEEGITRICKEKQEEGKKEISSLGRTGFLSRKKVTRNKINLLTLSIKVIVSRLDASLRNRIIRDALLICLPFWKKDVQIILSRAKALSIIRSENREPFSIIWEEKKHEKNLLGELNSFIFSTSHPAENLGLTRNILTDMVWSIEMCLCKNISLCIDRALLLPEIEIIENCAMRFVDPLIFLWEKTASDSRDISSRVSFLPEKWKEEEKKKKDIKADESYLAGDKDKIKSFLAEGRFPRGFLIEGEEFTKRREFLENSLKFKSK